MDSWPCSWGATRPVLTNERVQANGAARVVLKRKTRGGEGTTPPVMSPPEFMRTGLDWFIARAGPSLDRAIDSRQTTVSRRRIQGSECR